MTLTHQSIHALFNYGTPNSPQKTILKLPAKLQAGWVRSLVGKELDDATYAKLMELKGPRPKGIETSKWRAGQISPQKKTDTDPELNAWL